jgi:hypothetical protein
MCDWQRASKKIIRLYQSMPDEIYGIGNIDFKNYNKQKRLIIADLLENLNKNSFTYRCERFSYRGIKTYSMKPANHATNF